MKKAAVWILVVLVLLAAAAAGGRWYATQLMNERAVTPDDVLGAATPMSDSMPFSRLAISSGDRTLIGWWVRAGTDSTPAPAVLFLHGNRSNISDYVPLIAFFRRQG